MLNATNIQQITRKLKRVGLMIRVTIYFIVNIIYKKTILIGTPNYTNIGDTAIAEASRLWINRIFRGYKYIQLQEIEYLKVKKILKFFITKQDILFVQGGGNMGDRYPGLDDVRREIVLSYPKNKVVFMPVTIYFSESTFAKTELLKSIQAYNSHSNLTILTRDEQSCIFARKNFYNVQVVNIPDIVTSMEGTNFIRKSITRNNKVLVSKRNDIEQKYSIEEVMTISKVKESEYTYQDTELFNEKNQLIYKTKHHNFQEQINDLYEILSIFASHKLVITDRYHGLIFSYITKTPCIVIDNSDHKIREGVKWFDDCNYIFYIGNEFSKIPETIHKIESITELISSQKAAKTYTDFNSLYKTI